ncbi:hypothetical protein M9Y10_008993 [Tritrichomonas musculus]|uniref:Uncharacterized protein n=1 Tax=Tritrichomonas musculus TaxID=1915356 RepID=A0ABR2J0M4_9EUKA
MTNLTLPGHVSGARFPSLKITVENTIVMHCLLNINKITKKNYFYYLKRIQFLSFCFILKRAILNWINEKSYLPTTYTDAFNLFTRETKLIVSKVHFFEIYSKATRIQKIKTGGVYTRTDDLIEVIVQRSFYNVNMLNTISINEKPIIVNNYKQNRVRVKKSTIGKNPSSSVSSFKCLNKLSNLYLICAISCNCIVLYYLSSEPINTKTFNTFIHKVCWLIKVSDKRNFLDNASFHGVSDFTKDFLHEKMHLFACQN